MSSEAGTESVGRPDGYTYQASRVYGDGPAAIEVGVERVTGRRYLRTAMLHRDGEFDEYNGIDLHEFNVFLAEPDAAVTFADDCQRGEHANRWYRLRPGRHAHPSRKIADILPASGRRC